MRVSQPQALFDAQLTYDLQPLLFEQLTDGSGAAVAHDSTNRCATLTLSTTPTDGYAYMQSFEHIRYQPGKSQLIFITFNFNGGTSDVIKLAGYSDGSNGIEVRLDGTTPKIALLSDTSEGDEIIAQSAWNLDTLDGDGASGIDIDFTKVQIAVIDLQALYVGRVRVGFDLDGQIVYAHEFLHANQDSSPYIQTASLPIRCGMVCSAEASATMKFICASVSSEGGQEDVNGFSFAAEGTVTASSGARTHILSIRPNTTFNSLANRTKFVLESIELLVTGSNPVLWELCIGQAISGTTTYTDVNATYSAFEFNTAGTIDGDPAIVIASGYAAASVQTKSAISSRIANRYPITLDSAGAVRALGTMSVIVTGIGGTSATRVSLNWKELR
jgi:hypothetical protein